MKDNCRKIPRIIAGMGLLLAALLASQLGLDNDPVWGAKRYAIFFAGVAILLFSLFRHKGNFIRLIAITHDVQLYLEVAAVGAVVIIYYVWGVSLGLWSWTKWPCESNFYNLQANAFLHGQLALEVQPDPALLAFKGMDVYVPESRKGIPMLWDATLYNGRYYMYWGPVPAILLAGLKFVHPAEVGDNVLTFLFLSGTFLFMTALILDFWRRYYRASQRWTVLLAVAFIGTLNPLPYLLFEPRIYEASIISAQFFLMGGLYWLFSAFHRPTVLRFGLAGLLLTCSVGSRTATIPPVAFLALVTLIWVIKFQRARTLELVSAFALPLLIGAAGYGWFNYARFGSAMEFGLRYQITSYNQMTERMFALQYIPFNTYKALFNPLQLRDVFPYIFPTRWVGPASLEEGNYPFQYELFAEKITGILYGSPFVVFASLSGSNRDREYRWVFASLAGSVLLGFFVAQLFFFASMRYLLDFVPSLALLAVAGFWRGLELLEHRPTARAFLIALAVLLIAYGSIVSMAIAFSAHIGQIKDFNPQMLKEVRWAANELFR